MTWFFFEQQNRELRTHPTGFGDARITDITWTKDWAGQPVQENDHLATVTWSGGAQPQLQLVAPLGCAGRVARTFDIDLMAQALLPSQLLLYLERVQ
jgi:hypothetical protein